MKQCDTTILLGAGSSADAGVPLMSHFVDRMWELASRGRSARGLLNPDHRSRLEKAIEVRESLVPYHSRAAFDDWNIEDILSILSFSVLSGEPNADDRYAAMVGGIALTIDLSCDIQHSGRLDVTDGRSSGQYHSFWVNLLTHCGQKNLQPPTIITFNYDLVLERSLLLGLCGSQGSNLWNKLPWDGLVVKHHFAEQEPLTMRREELGRREDGRSILVAGESENPCVIEILKPHGSLGFHRRPAPSSRPELPGFYTVEDPLIVPPVSNKSGNDQLICIWKRAIEVLRSSRRLVACGYSMPATDSYMRFFLKTALGPNLNLSEVLVFDPILWTDGPDCSSMQSRFQACFTQEFSRRVQFRPSTSTRSPNGNFSHFVRALDDTADAILF